MKELLLLGVLVFATGCGGLFDYSDLIDVEPEPSSSFTPEPEPELQALVLDDGTVVPVPTNDWMEPGESIAFIAADNGLVCRRLTANGWDDVMLTGDGGAPRGVDIGGDGSILISDPDNIRRLLPDWSDVEELTKSIPGVELGEIGCDHKGNIVAAAKTTEGSKILVFNEVTGVLIDESATVPDTVITGIEVERDVVYVTEAPADTLSTALPTIVKYDLTVSPPERTEIVPQTPIAGTPTGVTMVDTDTIAVGVAEEAKIYEINVDTGAIEAEIELVARRVNGVVGIHFNEAEQRYYVTDGGREMAVFDLQGRLLETHADFSLQGANAFVMAQVSE